MTNKRNHQRTDHSTIGMTFFFITLIVFCVLWFTFTFLRDANPPTPPKVQTSGEVAR